MNTFKRATIEKKLTRVGLADQSIRGSKKLELRYNGRPEDDFCYIVIRNLADPDDGMYDHFTSYYPETIKAAINEMTR